MAKPQPPAPLLTPAEQARVDNLIGLPTRAFRNGTFFLIYTQYSDQKMYQWEPETPEEIAEATRFYQAAHGLGPFTRPILPGRPTSPDAGELALIRGIIAHRDDHERYLVYADYLTDQGNSQGDYIRTCVRREQAEPNSTQRADLEAAAAELLAADSEQWFRPLFDIGLRPILSIGPKKLYFPDQWVGPEGATDRIEIERPGLLPGAADRLFAAAPMLRKLTFAEGHLDVSGLARVRQLDQIDEIVLGDNYPDEYALGQFLRSKHLSGLRRLQLSLSGAGMLGWQVLAESPAFPRLTELDVQQRTIVDGGLQMLVSAAGQLASLTIRGHTVTVTRLTALARSDALAGLTRLSLPRVRLDNATAGIAALADATFAPTLRTLNLSETHLGDSGVEALASGRFAELIELDLSGVQFGPRGVAALAQSVGLSKLAKLRIEDSVPAEPGRSRLLERFGPSVMEYC